MNVIVTGGTKGIGKAIVEKLLSNGAHVAFCARTSNDVLECANKWKNTYPKQQIIGKVIDVSKKDDIIEFGNDILLEMQLVDVLINNAGYYAMDLLLDESEGMLESMIETNLYSAYHLSRMIAKSMKNNSKGHIINICSIASLKSYPNSASYSISKFALLGLSKVLRQELKQYNVKVSSVLPGATWSNSWSGVDLPKSRLIATEDIAKLIWSIIDLSASAVVEDILIQPQLGEL